MSTEELAYDVAVSFVAVDEAIAIELAQLLAGRLRVFVYSERQRELVGREGMSEFTRVFERDSRIVVVLYRAGWAETPWTGVEQTAIQERGFRRGWDFFVFVPLDGTPPPDWLPKTRIWFDFARFGMAGLATIVEARFEDAGGTPKVETAVELAKRLRREQDADVERVLAGWNQPRRSRSRRTFRRDRASCSRSAQRRATDRGASWHVSDLALPCWTDDCSALAPRVG